MKPSLKTTSSVSSDKDKGVPVKAELRLPPPPKPDDPDYERKYAIYQQILQKFTEMAKLVNADGINIGISRKTHDDE
jgi:hypothetical protein